MVTLTLILINQWTNSKQDEPLLPLSELMQSCKCYHDLILINQWTNSKQDEPLLPLISSLRGGRGSSCLLFVH
jgi:hypothetical protein